MIFLKKSFATYRCWRLANKNTEFGFGVIELSLLRVINQCVYLVTVWSNYKNLAIEDKSMLTVLSYTGLYIFLYNHRKVPEQLLQKLYEVIAINHSRKWGPEYRPFIVFFMVICCVGSPFLSTCVQLWYCDMGLFFLVALYLPSRMWAFSSRSE